MSTDTDESTDGTTKINVRVPTELLEGIDETYEKRGYTSRSEAIRDALRDWLENPAPLSDEIVEALQTSRKQAERGETHTLEEVADRFDVELDEA